MDFLREANLDRDGKISLQELKEKCSCDQDSKHYEDMELLFGKRVTAEDIFKELDADGSDEITFDEFIGHIQSRSICIRAMMEGSDMTDIHSLGDYAAVLFDTMCSHTSKYFMKEQNIERTVGLNADYVQTADFDLDTKDKEFLIKQGILGTLCYLKTKA